MQTSFNNPSCQQNYRTSLQVTVNYQTIPAVHELGEKETDCLFKGSWYSRIWNRTLYRSESKCEGQDDADIHAGYQGDIWTASTPEN